METLLALHPVHSPTESFVDCEIPGNILLDSQSVIKRSPLSSPPMWAPMSLPAITLSESLVSPLQFPVSFCFENFSGRENWRLQCWRHWSLWHYSSMEVRGLSLSQPELLVSPARYSGQLSIWYQSRWRGGGGRETEISINKAELGFIWSTSPHSSGAGTMFWHL